MKKTYMIPATTVLKIDTVHMIASSETVRFGGSYNEGTVIQSRRGGSFWDDEEYE